MLVNSCDSLAQEYFLVYCTILSQPKLFFVAVGSYGKKKSLTLKVESILTESTIQRRSRSLKKQNIKLNGFQVLMVNSTPEYKCPRN